MSRTSSDLWIEVPDTPLFSYKRHSNESFESKHSDSKIRKIKTNFSSINNIPSTRKKKYGGTSLSKRRRYGIGALVIGSAVAIITILLGIFFANFTKPNQTSSSSQPSTIIAALPTITISMLSLNTVSTTDTSTSSTTKTSSTTTASSTEGTTSTSTTTSTETTSTSATTSTETTSISTTTSTETTSTSTTSSTKTTSTSTTSSTETTSTSVTTSTVTTSTSATTTTTTSIFESPSLWSFENNNLDSLSIFNGVGVNSPTYRIPGINGYSSALSVNGAAGQFVEISTYRNFSYTSFTIEMWFYCTALTSADYGLFGQHYAQVVDQSLHIQIRNFQLYMGFWADDLSGSTTIRINTWYHAAFVFDYSTLTQTVYLNGQIDGNRSTSPYQGTSGSIVIGKTEQVPGTPNYFTGYIDEVSVVMRAKNASEILDDATLVTWHSFDSTSYYRDSGSLNLMVTSSNITSVNGRVNQAISFNSSSSYYQTRGFIFLGISNYSYSIALWVNPSSINGSLLVHLSTTTNGQGWCVGLIGFSSIGRIVITGLAASSQQVIGPILPANIWTHVARTYSFTNGHRLYINGTVIGTTGSTIFIGSGLVNILTLGSCLQGVQMSAGGTCNSQSIVPTVYRGLIDEFRVYSRELNANDVYTLANS